MKSLPPRHFDPAPTDLDVGLIEDAPPGSAAADDALLLGRLAHRVAFESEAAPWVSWDQRAAELRAETLDPAVGAADLAQLWREDRHIARLSEAERQRLGACFRHARIAGRQEVIRQDEPGDFLLLVLQGTVSVERLLPGTQRARIGLAQPGDLLGEMSLIDGGTRFSSCVTQGPVRFAVLDARDVETMMRDDPRLAVALLASLSRRLSLRLRQVSTRLSALLDRG